MKGVSLTRSVMRSISSLGAAALKPAHISAYGLALCCTLALVSPPSGNKAGAARAPERVAYSESFTQSPAGTSGVAWGKFGASRFGALEMARVVNAFGNSQRLVAAFEAMGYRMDLLREGFGTVPRVYLSSLPSDLPDIDSADVRKAVFIKTLLPSILRANEEILDRRELLGVFVRKVQAGRPLSQAEVAWIDEMTTLYDVKAEDRTVAMRELLRRIDIVPPSLALTQAALESGWGTSRFAQEANALFGQKAFSESVQGIISQHKNPADVHRMRSFNDLLDAVRAYMHNLNSHPAYGEFRAKRAEMRRAGGIAAVDSEALTSTLTRYSERGRDYTLDLRHLLKTNDLRLFDSAQLESDRTIAEARPRTGA